jgi:predicted nucleic acid-binding protein
MTKKVYVDSCVLIRALKDEDEDLALRAISEISQEGVEYIFSPLVELEVLPKPMEHGKKEQVDFFKEWFQKSSCVWYSEEVHGAAIDQAMKYSIAPMDAAHVATAIVGGADELVTTEKATKPMFRSNEVLVRNIFSN